MKSPSRLTGGVTTGFDHYVLFRPLVGAIWRLTAAMKAMSYLGMLRVAI